CYSRMLKYASFALIVAMAGFTEASMQNVSVKGIVICNKYRAANIHVELWEKDKLSKNDVLASTHTNKEGEFFLTGGNSELFKIKPYVKIHHECATSSNVNQTCTRKSKYDVPSEFIWNADTLPKDRKIYNMEYLSLDIFTKGEKEHCEKKKKN
ncbi:hypothetical protein PMAYCL1PPCAC_20674, partial [Pristionchus mayeri]